MFVKASEPEHRSAGVYSTASSLWCETRAPIDARETSGVCVCVNEQCVCDCLPTFSRQ